MKKLALSLLAATALAGCMPEENAGATPGQQGGEALFAAYCAACHGDDLSGGEVIAGKRAANLTTLAQRHDGTFPTAYVMSTIDGYARQNTHGPMPEFGELLGGPMDVWVDDSGTPTPTPYALIALADYIEARQR